jgi:glycosyltransferase involved in cell wall biosynthesis
MVWHASSDTDVQRGLKIGRSNKLRTWLERKLLSRGIRDATAVVTQTEQQASLLHQEFGRVADAVIPNFHPDAREVLDKSGPPRIVWVSNLKRLKQPEAFLRLAARLGDIRDARFVLIGAGNAKGSDAGWLAQLLRDAAALPQVENRGELTQDEVNAELAKAHVFVNTSLYEGFANTFIQAWMRAVPVVSLNVNPDAVFDRHPVGFHAGNEERLAQQVRRLIEDPAMRLEYGRRAREYALEHHSMKNAVRLEALLARSAAAARAGRG